MQSPPDDPLLSVAEVMARLACSRATVYRWAAADAFPTPLKIGSRTKFYSSEITAWMGKNRGLPAEPERLRLARAKANAELAASA